MEDRDENKINKAMYMWIIGLCVALVITLVVWLSCSEGGLATGKTQAEVEEELMVECNTDLANPNSSDYQAVKKLIENLHVTVTVTSLRCTACRITLREGKEKVHDIGSDVERISLVVVSTWDGWVDKGGTTALQLDFNQITNEAKMSVLHTTALVTLTSENIEAFMKGFVQGFLIMSL